MLIYIQYIGHQVLKHNEKCPTKRTQRPSRIYNYKCYIRESKNIDDYEFEFPSMVQKKKHQWPLTKNENIEVTLHQYAVSDEIFRAIEKKIKKK